MRVHAFLLAIVLGLGSGTSARPADAFAPPSSQEPSGIRFGGHADRWEARLGGAAYDAGPLTPDTFTGGVVNGEILAPSFGFLSVIGSPRPYVGTDIAVSDDPVHALYGGLNWELSLTSRLYLGASLGGAVLSDEKVVTDKGAVRDFGSPVLFHLQASAGFDFTPNLGVQAYLNHFSNANLSGHNSGLESSGARLVWRF